MAAIKLVVPKARRISDALLIVVSAFIGLSLIGQCSKYLLGHPKLKGFVPTFYVDLEPSAPTWYSSAALGLAGALLSLIAAAKFQMADRFRWHWVSLAGLFFLLSMDEIAGFHELPVDPLREALAAGGLLYYTWVIPGAAVVALVGCLFLRFYLALPRRTQRGFLLAAILFVGGSIGVEMLSGAQADAFGEENLDYALIVTIEEFLEMLGIVVFIRALLEYIEQQLGGLQVGFAGD
jgi:hypothetical protein